MAELFTPVQKRFLTGMILTTLLPFGVIKLSGNNIRGTVTATFNTSQFVVSFAGSAISGILWDGS
jgi:hypothetical protein